jgi:hypothetical protein
VLLLRLRIYGTAHQQAAEKLIAATESGPRALKRDWF